MTSTSLHQACLLLHADDDVAIARDTLPAGTVLDTGRDSLVLVDDVPGGHKVAVRALPAGAPVHKYGQVIGFAVGDVEPGSHVHSHNLAFGQFEREHEVAAVAERSPEPAPAPRTFDGYVRADGRVGTRNYLGIVTSVNCSATAARAIARQVESSGILDDYPGVDGVFPLTHGLGCGMAGAGNEGFEVLRRTLTGYAQHPNFAGILMLGLGCEVNQVRDLADGARSGVGVPLHSLAIQDLGGTRKTVAAGVEQLAAMLPEADAISRQSVPASELVMAMECGGSDAWSGITANPALGAAADLLVAQGGTAVFGETTEIYGAEHLLTRRAAGPEVAEKLLERIRWWEKHVQADGSSIDNNPSPGNKAGGLTTILEKSLGAVAKGGTTTLRDVVKYAERITSRGLVFMDTPGYDPVNATGMVAGGATVLCFTTGRGSAFGCKPTPSLKLATNTAVYERMRDDMDLDCGPVATGGATVEEMGQLIFDRVLDVASGRRTASEELGYGDEEFVPWQLATTL
ncbi:UxaA family hydrolase [Nocardioides sp. NPDC057767]|uniref:UxaA family hydrolase n=1 Tax=unclassified Nocardioides TaxID=2615069 RepID=UPI003670A1A1